MTDENDVRASDEDIQPEYDFSRAERGKHYRPNAVFHLPVYLEDDVRSFLVEKSTAKGV